MEFIIGYVLNKGLRNSKRTLNHLIRGFYENEIDDNSK